MKKLRAGQGAEDLQTTSKDLTVSRTFNNNRPRKNKNTEFSIIFHLLSAKFYANVIRIEIRAQLQ